MSDTDLEAGIYEYEMFGASNLVWGQPSCSIPAALSFHDVTMKGPTVRIQEGRKDTSGKAHRIFYIEARS